MTDLVKHLFESAKSDGADNTLVQPGDWNAAHVVTCVGAKATKTAQAVANATETVLTFAGTEEYDTDTFHDTATNPGRLTIPSGKDGKYRLSAWVRFDANATGDREVILRKNGTTEIAAQRARALNSGSRKGGMTITCDAALVATDYVEVLFYQDSGGSLDVNSLSWFACQFLGA